MDLVNQLVSYILSILNVNLPCLRLRETLDSFNSG